MATGNSDNQPKDVSSHEKKEEQVIVCPNCGAIIRDIDFIYCPICNARLKTEEELAEAQFTWNSALSLVFLTFITYFIAYYAVEYYLMSIGGGAVLITPITYAFFLMLQGVFALVPIVYFKLAKLDFVKLILPVSDKKKIINDILIGVLFSFIFYFLIEFEYQISVQFFGLSPELIELIRKTTPTNTTEYLIQLIATVLILAPSNEILVRGILQRYLSKAHGPIIGIFGASIFYSLLFLGNIISFITLLTLQILLGVLFEYRKRSLYSTIPAHMMFWLVSMILPLLL
ncbi:MAG: hypothetical protein DRO67_01580 [Candidatus Asgardarchaeum californiense]|nr:MAG: hypothetical protein DRO67_01580 [Candidatus Asgardarchaeum californiense]